MRKSWIFAVVALALVVGVGFYLRSLRYEAVKVTKGSLTEAVYGLGRVKSDQRFNVIIGVISRIARLHVDEGDQVEKGDLLIQFDSGATFRAPFRGTVTFVAAREGETALPNATILRLENLAVRYIELSLEQEAALRVAKGQRARVSFESLRGTVLPGEVKALFPREEEFLAHVSLRELPASVLPGMTADVSVEIGTINDATLVPLKAVQNGMVTVRVKGNWEKRKIEIGHVDGVYAEVKNGAVSAGDEVRVRRE